MKQREIESNPVYTGGIVNPLEIPTITEAKREIIIA